jgi:hypothetical protein
MICERTANPVNPEGPRLGAGQMPEPDHRALIDKARHVEAELGDRPCNLRDLSFGMHWTKIGSRRVCRDCNIPGCHFASFFIVVAIVLLAGAALTSLPPPRYRICGRLCNEAQFVSHVMTFGKGFGVLAVLSFAATGTAIRTLKRRGRFRPVRFQDQTARLPVSYNSASTKFSENEHLPFSL